MNKTELMNLREQILGDIVPLVLDSTDDGLDRFSLLLRIIQAGNASGEVYRRAYESAKKIEATDDRLEALMSLLDEVDFDTNRSIGSQDAIEENGSSQQDTVNDTTDIANDLSIQ